MKCVKNKIFFISMLFFLSLLAGCYENDSYYENKVTDNSEINAAYNYLNAVRQNPGEFMYELSLNEDNVKNCSKTVLKWNEILYNSAQRKAEDMADRNYFSHIDPDGNGPNYIAYKEGYIFPEYYDMSFDANNIESISAATRGTQGIGHIKRLIVDSGVADLGHRIHLLGLNSFYKKHVDIGIGFAYNPDSYYKYYFVVHTAVSKVDKK